MGFLSNLFGGSGGLFGNSKGQMTSAVPGAGGLSSADVGLIEQSLGLGSEQIHNRYKQLGLGQPSGDPATAAATGQSLTYAGPSSMETQDIGGLGQVAQAALGNLFNANQSNPAIPGSVANIGMNIQNQNQSLGALATQQGQTAGTQNFNLDPNQNVSSQGAGGQ
jgi:hypothetical protein